MSERTKVLAVIASVATVALLGMAKWLPFAAEVALVAIWICTQLMVRELYDRSRSDDGKGSK